MAKISKDEMRVRFVFGVAKIELYNVKIDEVRAILAGDTKGFSKYDIKVIENIAFVYDNFGTGRYSADLKGYLKMNEDVLNGVWEDAVERENAGHLRSYEVVIGGTTWRPPLENLEEQFYWIISYRMVGKEYIECFLELMRLHPLVNGNKRTSMLFVNMLLMHSKAGYLILMGTDSALNFMQRLVAYYGSGYLDDVRKYAENTLLCKFGG